MYVDEVHLTELFSVFEIRVKCRLDRCCIALEALPGIHSSSVILPGQREEVKLENPLESTVQICWCPFCGPSICIEEGRTRVWTLHRLQETAYSSSLFLPLFLCFLIFLTAIPCLFLIFFHLLCSFLPWLFPHVLLFVFALFRSSFHRSEQTVKVLLRCCMIHCFQCSFIASTEQLIIKDAVNSRGTILQPSFNSMFNTLSWGICFVLHSNTAGRTFKITDMNLINDTWSFFFSAFACKKSVKYHQNHSALTFWISYHISISKTRTSEGKGVKKPWLNIEYTIRTDHRYKSTIL
jgi:hypothetical protein